ncbi:MAG: hypothetical protein AAGH79_03920, partial [Bacteroidota bacterium]
FSNGYNNLSNFNRQFKAIMQVKPKEYCGLRSAYLPVRLAPAKSRKDIFEDIRSPEIAEQLSIQPDEQTKNDPAYCPAPPVYFLPFIRSLFR